VERGCRVEKKKRKRMKSKNPPGPSNKKEERFLQETERDEKNQ